MQNALSAKLLCARVVYVLNFQNQEDGFQWMSDWEYIYIYGLYG